MPHISVKLYPGQNEDQKAMLANELTKTLMSVLGSKKVSISVGIEEVAPDDWTQRVTEPEILGKPDTIYKPSGS
jgi:4-oxalocrotonate tautomerase